MDNEIKDAGTKPYGGTANSLGDASMSDLTEGVFDANVGSGEAKLTEEAFNTRFVGGVLGRPSGWER